MSGTTWRDTVLVIDVLPDPKPVQFQGYHILCVHDNPLQGQVLKVQSAGCAESCITDAAPHQLVMRLLTSVLLSRNCSCQREQCGASGWHPGQMEGQQAMNTLCPWWSRNPCYRIPISLGCYCAAAEGLLTSWRTVWRVRIGPSGKGKPVMNGQ